MSAADDKEYLVEKGGPQGYYTVRHCFDPRHGLAYIGGVTKTEKGWTAMCNEVPVEGSFKTRGAACDAVFDHWKNNFSKAALERRFSGKTVGGMSIRFVHALKDSVVAASIDKQGRRFMSSWSWDGKFSCADQVDGERDTTFDLVALTPEQVKRMEQRQEANSASRSMGM